MATSHTAVITLLAVFALGLSHPVVEDSVAKPAVPVNNDEGAIVHTKNELTENERNKREFFFPAWPSNTVIRIPGGENYAVWQPQYYQLKRPYFIPIWGSAGHIPVFLPPQPLYINPGFPIDNPPKRFPGFPYLPPVTEPPSTNETTTAETDTKFGEDGPVWDHVSPKPSGTSMQPTRPTRRPGQRITHPPLVHKESSLVPETAEKSAVSPIGALRPISGTAAKPEVSPPQAAKETPGSALPSRCVWAIISCCAADSQTISYSCFEQQGCTGAFWGRSPCESEFARSAISAAMNYYNSK